MPMSMSWQVRRFQELQKELSAVIQGSVEEGRRRALIAELEDGLEKRNTFLLAGHDYNRALADMKSGTLDVQHTREAVHLTADLPPAGSAPSWVEDSILAVQGHQLRGISPGFNVPAQGGQRLVPESGAGDSLVREIEDSVVWEYSLVARPSYPLTEIEARAEGFITDTPRRRRLWL